MEPDNILSGFFPIKSNKKASEIFSPMLFYLLLSCKDYMLSLIHIFTQVLYYFIPIVAFAAGILVSELIRRTFREHTNIHWRQITVGAEFIILLIVAFIPRGTFDVIANVAISFICSLQVQSFRKVNGNAYATTMCTGNLRSATEKLFQYHITKDKQERNKSLQYYGIILFFILGAGIGAWCSHFFAEKSVLICCALLLSAFLVMFIQPLSPENPENSSI